MRTEVKSSLLKSVSYDPANRILEIEFKPKTGEQDGKIYRYNGVSQETYDKFSAAESKGRAFLKDIKPAHSCTRVKEKEDAQSEKKADTETAPDGTPVPF
jgi:hypothetical protein